MLDLRFQVTGMTCAACSARVEKVTRAVAGVKKADVNLLAGTMQVEVENEAVAEAIIQGLPKRAMVHLYRERKRSSQRKPQKPL